MSAQVSRRDVPEIIHVISYYGGDVCELKQQSTLQVGKIFVNILPVIHKQSFMHLRFRRHEEALEHAKAHLYQKQIMHLILIFHFSLTAMKIATLCGPHYAFAQGLPPEPTSSSRTSTILP